LVLGLAQFLLQLLLQWKLPIHYSAALNATHDDKTTKARNFIDGKPLDGDAPRCFVAKVGVADPG
jgi:hypothetical protein